MSSEKGMRQVFKRVPISQRAAGRPCRRCGAMRAAGIDYCVGASQPALPYAHCCSVLTCEFFGPSHSHTLYIYHNITIQQPSKGMSDSMLEDNAYLKPTISKHISLFNNGRRGLRTTERFDMLVQITSTELSNAYPK